jgi:cell division protein FtsB
MIGRPRDVPEKCDLPEKETLNMITPRCCRGIALGILAVLTTAGAASAQSDADLRRENERLRTQVSDLQRELEAARNRIDQLEREVEKLRQLLAAAPPMPNGQAPEERVTIDESVPQASPRALLQAIKDGYMSALLDLDPGEPDSKDREKYLRELSRWARRVNRELKSPIEWHVRITDRAIAPGDLPGLEVVAVDPETDVVLGEPFPVRLPQATVRQLRRLEQRGALGVLVLRGVLMPEVMVNPQRDEQGLFNKPLFVGPFAEFSFWVEASSLTPPVEPKDRHQREEERVDGRS